MQDNPYQSLFIGTEYETHFNTCTKYYPDGAGGWYPVKKIVFDRPIYNPRKMEEVRRNACEDDIPAPTKFRDSQVWAKSYNRARQACFDYLMCNPELDTFLTFTVDPAKFDRFDYDEICKYLSRWLDNRVRRKGLMYILVPERHKNGAIHFHGLANFRGLCLNHSGKYNWGKYHTVGDLTLTRIAGGIPLDAVPIYNVGDLALGFSTAVKVTGADAQTKVSKYIWKYMTKQDGAKIGGRYYLHGGPLRKPRLEFSNESFEETRPEGAVVSYGGTSCVIVAVTRV